MKLILFLLLFIVSFLFLTLNISPITIGVVTAYLILWLIYVIVFIVIKEPKRRKINAYNKDLHIKTIPKRRTVLEVGYMLYGKIKSRLISISIIEMIRKKAFLLRYSPKIKNYVLISNDAVEELNEAEAFLKNWFVNNIGDGNKVSLSELTHDAMTNSSYFLSCYHDWHTIASFEGTKPNLVGTNSSIIEEAASFIVFSIFLIILGALLHLPIYLLIISSISTIIMIIYINSFHLRTSNGNKEYAQWLSFSKSLDRKDTYDNISDLPTVEKSIIYAKLFNKNVSKISSLITNKEHIKIEDSEFLLCASSGVIDEVCSKINKLVPLALMLSFIFVKNNGSRSKKI